MQSGERLTLYWEDTELERRQPVATTLTLVRTGKGWLRRAAEWARLAGGRAPLLSLGFEESSGDRSLFTRSLHVSLPQLAAGTYRLRLRITPRNGSPVTVEREVQVKTPRRVRR